MGSVDARGRLDDQPCAYRASREGQVFITCQGRTVTTVRGDKARRLLARLTALDEDGVQLALAKATGDFKRGNERRGR